MQAQKNPNDSPILPLDCLKRAKTSINIDCIKVHPLEPSLWAFAFYQQMPAFCGGLQVVRTEALEGVKLGAQSDGYVELGPLMHVEWLREGGTGGVCYLIAAARCDEAIVCGYQQANQKLVQCKRILLQTGIFCLYCDWRLLQASPNSPNLSVSAIVSTNQSSVFHFTATITTESITHSQIQSYNDHQYAVWACKLCPSPCPPQKQLMVVGDQVNCLYLYNLSSKTLLAKNRKAHSQGICEIVWMDQESVITGGFDGTLAIISVGDFGSVLGRLQLGGTVWRILDFCQGGQGQWENLLICNSSEKKFQIVNRKTEKTIWDSGNQHTSLAYAADFNGKTLVTVSFYDQQVRMWILNLSL